MFLNYKKLSFEFLLILFIFSFCFSSDLVLLGVSGNNSPAIERSLDQRVRQVLSCSIDYNIWDYVESCKFRKKIGFDDYSTLSRNLIESLRQFSNDSTVFVWFTLKNFSIKPKRKFIFGSELLGELTLTLHIYSLRFQNYTFVGDISGNTRKWKELIFFYPLDKGIHITAAEREEITQKLVDETALKASEMISNVVRSEKSKSQKGYNLEKSSKEPSVKEIFNIPVVEPQSIEAESRKKSYKTEEISKQTEEIPKKTVDSLNNMKKDSTMLKEKEQNQNKLPKKE
jgi:hypothetical protein